MSRFLIFFLVTIALLLNFALWLIGYPVFWPFLIFGILFLIGVFDFFSTHNILRNYPIIGHLRYMLEFVRPEVQQYFVATNTSGRPYSRELRTYIYKMAKNIDNVHPFGTEQNLLEAGQLYIEHSLNVQKIPMEASHLSVGGPECQKPYHAARINISAMSFGALSNRAIMALNRGAKLAGIAHDTGEGGLSPYHLKEGGDIIWQLGTAYFGCRTKEGHFDETLFTQKANLDIVKMIEIKLSQGAKPSHGGVLPATKITTEIAEIRGVEMGKDCISPPTHSAFSTPIELMQFIKKLRALTGGKPIGFKLCLGKREQFMAICKAMLETNIYPDFITVDGAEGGTGAAPVVYSNHVGTPGDEAVVFVHNCLVGINLRQHIRIIASGKVATSFDVLKKIAIGADMCNIARGMMFSIGCIQALTCHNNQCPTGVATQDNKRSRAINVNQKSIHVKNYYNRLMHGFLNLVGAVGINHPDNLSPDLIFCQTSRQQAVNFTELFDYVEPGNFLTEKVHPVYAKVWHNSCASRF